MAKDLVNTQKKMSKEPKTCHKVLNLSNQFRTTTHLPEWTKLKTVLLPCVAKDVKQMEHLFIAGRNANII